MARKTVVTSIAQAVAAKQAVRLTPQLAASLQAAALSDPRFKGYRRIWERGELYAYPPDGMDLALFKLMIP